ncbi:MAG: hypothetical protein JSV25_16005 [Spirochaetota bacterium]|nr:MAG: hypothetical protein JSV25_16005 [Spirochaetota bacterium]
MNGLEAILFAVFVVFVLVNLVIRFFVRKAKRQKMEGVQQPQETTKEESRFKEEEPWIPFQDFEEATPEIESVVQAVIKPELQNNNFQREIIAQEQVPGEFVQQESAVETPRESQLQSESFPRELDPRKRFDREIIARDQAPEVGRLEREMESGPESWEKERIEKLEGTIEVKTAFEEQTVSFWERIEKLTQLQKAIILSEVLGPPKGLQ